MPETTISWRIPRTYSKDISYTNIDVRGIYAIGFRTDNGINTIYVGQGGANRNFDGSVGERLDHHKDKPYIRQYDRRGTGFPEPARSPSPATSVSNLPRSSEPTPVG